MLVLVPRALQIVFRWDAFYNLIVLGLTAVARSNTRRVFYNLERNNLCFIPLSALLGSISVAL